MPNIGRSPLIEELDAKYSPVALFELFHDQPFSFFLDSAMDPQKLGRYSLMGSTPFLVLKSRGHSIILIKNGEETLIEGNPFDVLDRFLELYQLAIHPDVLAFHAHTVSPEPYTNITKCTNSNPFVLFV